MHNLNIYMNIIRLAFLYNDVTKKHFHTEALNNDMNEGKGVLAAYCSEPFCFAQLLAEIEF